MTKWGEGGGGILDRQICLCVVGEGEEGGGERRVQEVPLVSLQMQARTATRRNLQHHSCVPSCRHQLLGQERWWEGGGGVICKRQ